MSARRRLNDTQWVSEGPRRVYSVSDLENLKTQAMDLTLLKVAAQSELSFRKNEGRFFSPSDDFTLLRIHGDFLPQFLETCQIKKILCNPDGMILPFLHAPPLSLKIRVESQQNFFSTNDSLFLECIYGQRKDLERDGYPESSNS